MSDCRLLPLATMADADVKHMLKAGYMRDSSSPHVHLALTRAAQEHSIEIFRARFVWQKVSWPGSKRAFCLRLRSR